MCWNLHTSIHHILGISQFAFNNIVTLSWHNFYICVDYLILFTHNENNDNTIAKTWIITWVCPLVLEIFILYHNWVSMLLIVILVWNWQHQFSWMIQAKQRLLKHYNKRQPDLMQLQCRLWCKRIIGIVLKISMPDWQYCLLSFIFLMAHVWAKNHSWKYWACQIRQIKAIVNKHVICT